MRRKLHEQKPKIVDRDIKILEEIWRYGFRTYAELHEQFLKNYSESWGFRILKRLVLLGYIDELRAPNGTLLGWKSGHANRLPVHLSALKDSIPHAKTPKYFSAFNHDLNVRNVIDAFKKLPMTLQIVTEQEIRTEALSGVRGYSRRDLNDLTAKIPDAKVTLRFGKNELIAPLEVELSVKAAKRIQAKMEYYVTQGSHDFAIYICGTQAVLDAVVRNYKEVMSTSPKVKFSEFRRPIYFCTLLECKTDLLQANLFSLGDQFKFADFVSRAEISTSRDDVKPVEK